MSGGSPDITRAYVDLHAPACRALRAACGSVDEVSPETFTPFRGMSCGQVFLKPTQGFRFRAAPVAAWFPGRSSTTKEDMFTETIKSLRLERRLTLRDFCERVGLDPSNWSKVERGGNPPPGDVGVLERLAAFLVWPGPRSWH